MFIYLYEEELFERMKIQDIVWEYLRSVFNPWLSKNWYKIDKPIRDDLLILRDKLCGCHSKDEVKEVLRHLARLYMLSSKESKEIFTELLIKTEEYCKKNEMELGFEKLLKQYKVTLIVKDDMNKPVKSAKITVMYDRREIWKGETSSDGKATLNLNEGKYTVYTSISEDEWYGLNIVELQIPKEIGEKIIIIKKHKRSEPTKITVHGERLEQKFS